MRQFYKSREEAWADAVWVSHNIAKLESELGIVLLRRNRNNLAIEDLSSQERRREC